MAPVPRPLRILIVDDDERLNRALELRLNKAGFMTKSAFNGAEALALLESENFDLVMLDLVMPGVPGFTVLSEMKRKGDKTPTIVLSMLRQEEDVARVKELGAKEYFVKSPSYFDEVVKYAEQMSLS